MMRQVAGAFAEYEKARLVEKLRHARERKKARGEKHVGRNSHAQSRPDVVRLAKRLHQAFRTGERRSLREISAALAKAGHVNFNGQPFNPGSVKAMIDGPMPSSDTGARVGGVGPGACPKV
jgi:DNA invertase Pin-like site-specific DNA recombinase